MKKVLLLLLLVTGLVQAQVVNIPDANFKNYLLNSSWVYDLNEDGEIQYSEAQLSQQLQIYEQPGAPIESIQGIEAFTGLIYLDIVATVTEIDLSGLSQLQGLLIDNSTLLDLNLTGLTSLSNLSLGYAQIMSLDLSGLSALTTLQLYDFNALSTLTVTNPQLHNFYLSSTSLALLDLSQCYNLNSINFTFNSEDKDIYLNLKNGSNIENGYIYTTYSLPNTYKCFTCMDEGEADYFDYVDENVILSTYCSFTPGGYYNTIAGNLTFSNDGSCAGGVPVSTIAVQINDGTGTGTTFNNMGNYNFYIQSGTFTITPRFENDWFIATPASATVNFADDNNNTFAQNFCITPLGVHPDVEVVIVPTGAAHPGFDAVYKLIYKNKGNQTLSGNVTYTYDDAVLDFVSASPSVSSSSTGSLVWNYSNLLPFETREVNIVLNLNGPMEIPALEIDDELLFSAEVSPLTGDETLQDNTFGLKQIVSGSFDPNDITCLEGDVVAPEKIGEYLHYNINFENTGTAAATFIVVKDIINEEQFDVSTLQLMQASHDVEVRVQDNKVEFYFDDIQLGPLEKGNVVFKIKTLNTLQENDDVTQQAEIFFDYNWPIVTNEATTVFQTLGMGDFVVDSSIKIYPNPSEGLVNLSADNNITSVQLYDVQGRLLQAVNPDDVTAKLDISGRVSGIYFIKITTEAGVKVDKVVKK